MRSSEAEPTRVEGVETPSRPRPLPPAAETSFGRYVYIAELGRGGMGQVVRAYDPKLQREVALKRLHASTQDADATPRLIREAQAMAQLTHPNVVGVYDVELESEAVLLAMEFVAGRTLRAWLDEERAWPAVLEVFVQAGRGLQAAHEVGIVHRDFKPDNVLVADDGRVKVGDFGLARAEGSGAPGRGSGAGLDSQLTEAGSVMGTPRYMAPEQHLGETVGPAADQYAFCVTLWEALCGAPPFDARTIGEVVRSKAGGPPPWPDGVAVPKAIATAIRRGLEVATEARWPSMGALLDALALAPARRARRWALGLGGVLVLGGLGLWAGREPPASSSPCDGVTAELHGIWNDDARERIAAAFESTKMGYARTTLGHTLERLDAYAQRWGAGTVDACEATAVRHEQSAAIMALRMRCLERARGDLAAVVALLAEADADLVSSADTVLAELRPLARCDDVEALQAEIPPPEDPQVAARVDQLRDGLSQVSASLAAGRFDEAMSTVEPIVVEAEQLGHPPLLADARLSKGRLLDKLGRYDDAQAELSAALELGLRSGMWPHTARAASKLAYVVGHRQSSFAEAERLSTMALAIAQHLGDAKLEAWVRNDLATVLYAAARYDEAEAQLQLVLEIREQEYPEGDRLIASVYNNLGATLQRAGRYPESIESYEVALRMQRESLGPQHPAIAGTLDNLGNVLRSVGRKDDAIEHHRRALALREGALGPHHPDVAMSHNNLGGALSDMGRYEDAEAEHRIALASRLEVLGPDDRETGLSHHNLALALASQGRFEEAHQEYDATLGIWVGTLGSRHADVAMARHNLANLLQKEERYPEAREQHRLAIEIWTESLGEEHPYVGTATHTLGLTDLLEGQHEAAAREVRRAAEIREARRGPRRAPPNHSWAPCGSGRAPGWSHRRCHGLAGARLGGGGEPWRSLADASGRLLARACQVGGPGPAHRRGGAGGATAAELGERRREPGRAARPGRHLAREAPRLRCPTSTPPRP